jgi:hypothetical protein
MGDVERHDFGGRQEVYLERLTAAEVKVMTGTEAKALTESVDEGNINLSEEWKTLVARRYNELASRFVSGSDVNSSIG